jgi:hypothetical protein
MDRDLELVGRGDAVGPETEEAATMVLRGESTAETSVQARPVGYGGDERYRAYEGQVKTGRAWWPWLVAAAAAIALGIGGWLLYDNIRDQIDANEPVAVNIYTGILEQKAVALIDADGFEHNVRRLAERGRPARLRVPAGPGAGDEAAARVDRHDPRLQRQAEGDGAEPRRASRATPRWRS